MSNPVSGGQCHLIHFAIPMRAGALVQWLRLPAWDVGDRGFEPHSGLQVSKKQNVPSSLTHNDSIL